MFRPDNFTRPEHRVDRRPRPLDDCGARRLLLASGSSLDYGTGAATGARNRLLDIPNANLEDVLYLRTLDEARHAAAESRRHHVSS